MNTPSGKPDEAEAGAIHWFRAASKSLRIVLIVLHSAAIAAVLTELFFPFPEDSHAVERIHALDFPASYAIYGFTACVILVLLGLVLRRLVMRNEDYYREGQRW